MGDDRPFVCNAPGCGQNSLMLFSDPPFGNTALKSRRDPEKREKEKAEQHK